MKNIKYLILALSSAFVLPAHAQVEASAGGNSASFTGEELVFLVFGITVIGMSLVALAVSLHAVLSLQKQLMSLPEKEHAQPFNLLGWMNEKFGFGKLKPIEEEGEISLSHSYDGIVELDNGMPPWLRYLFTGTIIFAIVYLINYLVTENGLNPIQEYEQELAVAEKQAEQRKLLAANSIDESSVTMLENKAEIEEGKTLFQQNCKACHGGVGEGGVGPNLTDSYWLHGGKINDIFKTIKYGIPEKGMISWQAKLKPVEIQKVASYIITLQGTNPPNAKAPQGDLFEGEKVGLLK